MDLKEEAAIGDPSSHWYYIAKGRAIKSLVGGPVSSVLAVGAGSGVFSKMLVEEGIAGAAVCVDPNYAEERVGARRTDRIEYRRSVSTSGAPLVLMIDVIEHVDDDEGLIRDYAALSPEGARRPFLARPLPC